MATPSDVSKDAQIVALALTRGESADQINERLDRVGAEMGSQRWTRALNAGSLAYEFGRAIARGDWDTAELQLAQMRGLGAERVVLMGKMVSWGQDRPVDAEGRPAYTYRRFKQLLPVSYTAEQIEQYAQGYAKGMASGLGHDTPGYGDYIRTEFEFGAPQ